jgi:aldose 1-epimerase
VGRPLDTHGGAQYKAKENVYQTFLDPRSQFGHDSYTWRSARRWAAIFHAGPNLPTGRTVMLGSQTAHSAISLTPIGASVVRNKKSEETMMARRNARIPAMVAALLFLGAMTTLPYPTAEAKSKMQKQAFGKIQDGQSVDLYTLTNKYGMAVAISNFGGTLVSLKVPDRDGKLGDVVLGYDNPADYENGKAYFGGTIGRYGNRIAHGKFTLDGVVYSLPLNDGPNTLHGGVRGFNKHVWIARDVSSSAGEALELTYVSRDGEEGFPGTLTVKVVYTLFADENAVKIEYTATTDKDTVLNLTNHSYFNLSGQGNGDILQHQLKLYASQFTPVDVTLIPTGKLQDVQNTPFDFLQPIAIGQRINMNDEQLKFGRGYDHNWVLDKKSPNTMSLAARAYDPQSGRVLEVSTTEPGVQFYSGNFLDGTVRGKDGKVYAYRSAFCLETQHFPDSPNQKNFPSTELKPGQTLHSTSIYTFTVQK